MVMQRSLLRPLWKKAFALDLSFVVLTFILLGVVRIMGLAFGEINIVVVGFLVMWVIPVIFLDKHGRKEIGMQKPTNWQWMFLSLLAGFVTAVIIYLLGYLFYGTGIENWGVGVAHEYSVAEGDVFIPAVFVVVTFFSMLFSPIGEELYFRGIIQEVLVNRLSNVRLASFWGSLSFALIHIPHHAAVFSGRFSMSVVVATVLWTIFMFLVSYLFIYARRKTGSVWGAVVCHSGYVLGMNVVVYFLLLPKI